MSKTLTEAGGDTSTALPTSQEIVSSPSLQAQPVQAGSALSSDLMGIMGEGAKVAQTANTVSIKAAKRVAGDSRTSLALTMGEIDNKIDYNDPKSIRNGLKDIELSYQEIGRKTFDNEDSQRAFDDIYHTQTAASVAKTMGAMESSAIKLDARDLAATNNLSFQTQVNSNLGVNGSILDDYTDSSTAGGFYKRDAIQYGFAKMSTTSFDAKVLKNPKNYLTRAGYISKVGWNTDIASSIFEDEFGAYGSYTDKGIVFRNSVDNKAREEILRSWKSFESSMVAKEKSTIDPFKRVNSSSSTVVTNSTANYVPSVTLNENINKLTAKANDIANTEKHTETQLDNARINLQKMNNQLTITQNIERDIISADADTLRSYIENGKSIRIKDTLTGLDIDHKIPAAQYSKVIETIANEKSSALLGLDISTDAGVAEFDTRMTDVKRFEDITGVPTAFTKKYDTVFTSTDPVPAFRNANEVNQLLRYNDVMAQTDPSRIRTMNLLNDIKQAVGLLDPNDKDYNAKYAQIAHNHITNEKNQKLSMLNSEVVNKKVIKFVDDIASGDIMKGSFLDADMSVGTESAVMLYVTESGGSLDVNTKLKSLQFDDYGSALGIDLFGSVDQRYVVPLGASKTDITKSIDNVRESFNKRRKTDYDAGDIVIKTMWNSGTHNFVLSLHPRSNTNISLGTVTSRNSKIIQTKTVEEE